MRSSKGHVELRQRRNAEEQNAKLQVGLPYLYLDLVLRLRTPAAECLDPKSIWLQV